MIDASGAGWRPATLGESSLETQAAMNKIRITKLHDCHDGMPRIFEYAVVLCNGEECANSLAWWAYSTDDGEVYMTFPVGSINLANPRQSMIGCLVMMMKVCGFFDRDLLQIKDVWLQRLDESVDFLPKAEGEK